MFLNTTITWTQGYNCVPSRLGYTVLALNLGHWGCKVNITRVFTSSPVHHLGITYHVYRQRSVGSSNLPSGQLTASTCHTLSPNPAYYNMLIWPASRTASATLSQYHENLFSALHHCTLGRAHPFPSTSCTAGPLIWSQASRRVFFCHTALTSYNVTASDLETPGPQKRAWVHPEPALLYRAYTNSPLLGGPTATRPLARKPSHALHMPPPRPVLGGGGSCPQLLFHLLQGALAAVAEDGGHGGVVAGLSAGQRAGGMLGVAGLSAGQGPRTW